LETRLPEGCSASSSAWIAAMAVSKSFSQIELVELGLLGFAPESCLLEGDDSFSSLSIRSSLRTSQAARNQHRLQRGNVIGEEQPRHRPDSTNVILKIW